MSRPRVLKRVLREVDYYRKVLADPQTPALARCLLAAALAYLVSPIDLIPDFIPVIGYLDDLLIVVGLILLARLAIPAAVLLRHRDAKEATNITNSGDEAA